MAILASLPGLNLFTSLPSKPPHSTDPSVATSDPPLPPIPIPKYPPLLKSHKQRHPDPQSQQPSDQSSPARRRRRRGPVPVSSGVLSSDGDRSVVIGESGVSYLLPGAPFEFQYSYSETPNVKPLAIREPAFLPFAPPTMPRPWTGAAPKKTKKKKVPLYEPLNPPPPAADGVTRLELGRPIRLGRFPQEGKKREEILGEPLTKEEMVTLVKPHLHDNRQVNLGRDGLTHNMLELIHTHWKKRPICKVRCKGVPTVDMDNVCRRLEEKTWGKIIFRSGGVVYLFRGRNYNHSTRPQYPIMLWKPATPVYPKLIQEAPEGLTKDEADELRMKGKNLIAICKLAKHGVYLSLVKDVQDAFEGSPLVKVDCKGMNPSDYKKLGAKLKDLVPCVLLSFDDEQILMWRGKGWKSMYRKAFSYPFSTCSDAEGLNVPVNPNGGDGGMNAKAVTSSPRMMSLWNWAIETSKALLLDELDLGPDALLKKVEEFEAISGATDQSNLTFVQSREVHEDGHDPSHEDDESYQIASLEELDSFVPLGSLPVDTIAKQLGDR